MYCIARGKTTIRTMRRRAPAVACTGHWVRVAGVTRWSFRLGLTCARDRPDGKAGVQHLGWRYAAKRRLADVPSLRGRCRQARCCAGGAAIGREAPGARSDCQRERGSLARARHSSDRQLCPKWIRPLQYAMDGSLQRPTMHCGHVDRGHAQGGAQCTSTSVLTIPWPTSSK